MTLYEKLTAPPPPNAPVRLDRSTLEKYSLCPSMGMFNEKHPDHTGSLPATTGQEAHDVISWAVAEWMASLESPVDSLEINASMTRPDVQPEVLSAIRPVIYSLGRLCRDNTPNDILRYDGGEGPQSGQLSMQVLPASGDQGPVVLTGELDILMSTRAETIVRVIDWKTGWKEWTYTQVAASFQARFYALLVLHNYPKIERVEYQICMTRKNKWTAPVTFTRRDADDFLARCLTTIEARRVALLQGGWQEAETWPAPSHCRICDCLLACPLPDTNTIQLGENPIQFALVTQNLREQVEAREKLQDDYVDLHGPITTEHGTYARHPATAIRKRPAKFKVVEVADDGA